MGVAGGETLVIDVNFISNGLVLFLNDLMYSLTPMVSLYIGLRLMLAILSLIGRMIVGAFQADVPEPLSRQAFEARYGLLTDELLADAERIRTKMQPYNKRIIISLTGCLVLVVAPFFAVLLSSKNDMPGLFGPMIAAFFVAMVGFSAIVIWRDRLIGPEVRAWKARVRAQYNVAPKDTFTLRISRKARA